MLFCKERIPIARIPLSWVSFSCIYTSTLIKLLVLQLWINNLLLPISLLSWHVPWISLKGNMKKMYSTINFISSFPKDSPGQWNWRSKSKRQVLTSVNFNTLFSMYPSFHFYLVDLSTEFPIFINILA